MTKEHIFYIQGMHCASCEVLIEKKLLELKGIESADASTTKGQSLIVYQGEKPTSETLNKIFKENGYFFSENPPQPRKSHTLMAG